MLVAGTRYLGRMRNADHLTFPRHVTQRAPNDIGGSAADASVDFVINHDRNTGVARSGRLNSQSDARQLAPGRNFIYRARCLIGVGRNQEFDSISAVRLRGLVRHGAESGTELCIG